MANILTTVSISILAVGMLSFRNHCPNINFTNTSNDKISLNALHQTKKSVSPITKCLTMSELVKINNSNTQLCPQN